VADGETAEPTSILPFMLKFLGIASPHSLHVHPSRTRAIKGFEREAQAGIPALSAERVYVDAFERTEFVVARGSLETLCGFRPPDELAETVALAESGGHRLIRELLKRLKGSPGRVEYALFSYDVLKTPPETLRTALQATERRMRELRDSGRIPHGLAGAVDWTIRMIERFPFEIGALAPFVLNYVELRDGDALLIAPGEPHTHLQGAAIEASSNSDNILRAAITKRRADVAELLSNLNFDPRKPPIMSPERYEFPGVTVDAYPVVTPRFQLERYELHGGELELESFGDELLLSEDEGASIALASRGAKLMLEGRRAALATSKRRGRRLPEKDSSKGDRYAVSGHGSLWRACAPRLR
jgi:mannose-6-phosphate isomerase